MTPEEKIYIKTYREVLTVTKRWIDDERKDWAKGGLTDYSRGAHKALRLLKDKVVAELKVMK